MVGRGTRWTAAMLVAVAAVVGTGCSSPPPIADLVSDRFVRCMSDAGVDVAGVNVVVGSGRHIERFEWTAIPANAGTDATGQRCEDEALEQYTVSRT
jgi:hypothetical protein